MSVLKVRVWETHEFTCSNCCKTHHEPINLVYDDELELNFQTMSLLSELSLKSVMNESNTCITVYAKIIKAFKELTNNVSAYEDWNESIEPVKIFLWGIRLTIEEYPEGKIEFINLK